MKAMWKGTITFALISIPVKLYTATKKKDISFHLLHKADSSPIEYKRFCVAEDKEVGWDDIVRGYEYQKKKFITLSEEELEKLPQEASRTIDIQGFVDHNQIDPIYFNKSYYMEPAPEAVKPYALLREAMKKSGKLALSRFTLREKEHMCVIRLEGDVLLLETLFYADEIQSSETLSVPGEAGLNEAEVNLARELINRFTVPFRPQEYKDTYREALMKLIQAKLEGKEIAIPAPPKPAKVVNLMDALRKSLEKTAGVPSPGQKAIMEAQKPEVKEVPKPKLERKRREKVHT